MSFIDAKWQKVLYLVVDVVDVVIVVAVDFRNSSSTGSVVEVFEQQTIF